VTSANDHLIRGINLQNQGVIQEARAAFEESLRLDPANGPAHYSLGLLELNDGNVTAALEQTRRGIAAAPQFAALRYLQGALYQRTGDLEAALRSFDEALVIDPNYVEVLLNSGALLRGSMFRHKDALERFNRILQIDPTHAAALGNCGIMLTEFKQSEQAIAMFEKLVQLHPEYDYALGLLLYERMHICDWREFESLTQRITDGIRANKRVCKTLAYMAVSDSAEYHFKAARIFASHYCPPANEVMYKGEAYGHKRIHLAYVSPDFREHPVGHLMAGIYEQHDKSRFETIAISLSLDDQSRLRARMVKAFDHFIDARSMTARQIAQLMRDMEVDIAIDLGGYTSDTRTEIFSYRPAPVQVNYLGYPGTMGTSYYDYILADRHIIPAEHQPFYSEKVAYLPNAYLPTDNSVQVAEHTPTRAECGLPETGFVFCSFSHDYKISPPVFDCWMRLLQQTPGSVLWLVSRGDVTQSNLRREALARGIAPERLVFAKRVPLVEDHLARYRQADLFLDTHPYNAHTTAADALMVGLPVVTYAGGSFPSRVAGSLLQAIGVPELNAADLAGYEALALALAQDPQRLTALRARILANQNTHPLFDTPRFCRDLEDTIAALRVDTPGAQTPAQSSPLSASGGAPQRKLHIGGRGPSPGWELMNARPGEGVDHVGNANDLSRFADNSLDVIYSSHVLEHLDYQDEIANTLKDWLRALKPGGLVQISVPDLAVLARLLGDSRLDKTQRFQVMRMMFGGHTHEFDFHQTGLTEEFLTDFLQQAGFVQIERVRPFGLFPDNSDMPYAGVLISLNMQARKAAT
jgi:predicted O-linked N-acetylglucosamine transferase (SPINDLY family)/predicted SAM-dependent methyltransferase